MISDNPELEHVLEFHGIVFQNGEVLGKFTSPACNDGYPFAMTEEFLFENAVARQQQLYYCPERPTPKYVQNFELELHALAAIQTEKRRYKIPLNAPDSSIVKNTANYNSIYRDELDWAYDVLKREIEFRNAGKYSTATILSFPQDNIL